VPKSEIGHLTNLPRKDGKVRVAGLFPSNPDTIIFADKLFSVDKGNPRACNWIIA
jgi:hypothetical protein